MSRLRVLVSIAALLPLAGCDVMTGISSSDGPSLPALTTTASAVAGRAGHIAALLPDGRVLVAGGTNASTRLASAEIFSPASQTWSAAPGMSVARLGHAAVSLADGRVLVLGGHSVAQPCNDAWILKSAEVYSAALGTWTAAAPMNSARNSPVAIPLVDGRVLVAGGGNRCGQVYGHAEIYNPVANTWTMTGSMKVARQAAAAVRLADGRVLVAGGVGNGQTSFGSLASAEIYDPATGQWTLTGDMSVKRQWGSEDVSASGALALLPDGRVFAAGGFDSCWQVCPFVLHGSAEIFSPASGAWTLVGPMARARSHHRVSVLPSGHVLVAGGQAAGSVLGEAEVVDPSSGAFAVVGTLGVARYDYSATALDAGRILIAQGQGADGPLSSAEIFTANINRAPVANAGAAVAGDEGAELAFSAAGSSDPDGDALTYTWNFGDGSASVRGRDVRHAYADDGVYAVTLTVSDGNQQSTAATSAIVANVAPAVGFGFQVAVLGEAILAGETYGRSGEFSDPGADIWSATVDYGDGSGVQPLALAGQSFSVSHRYSAPGVYTVTVTVSDDDGGTGSATLAVTVQSPQDALGSLLASLDELARDGGLQSGLAHALGAKLEAAIQQIDRGNTVAAMNQLEAFVNELNALLRARQISPEVAWSLLDAVNRIKSALSGM